MSELFKKVATRDDMHSGSSEEVSVAFVKDEAKMVILDKDRVNVTLGGEVRIDLVVDISSAELLACGTTPIVLLAAAGAGKYYDAVVDLEYTAGGTAYTLPVGDDVICKFPTSGQGSLVLGFIDKTVDTVASVSPSHSPNVDGVTATFTASRALQMNESLVLTTTLANDPTLGTGTVKAKISYILRTHNNVA